MSQKTRNAIAKRIIVTKDASNWGYEDFEKHPHVIEYRASLEQENKLKQENKDGGRKK